MFQVIVRIETLMVGSFAATGNIRPHYWVSSMGDEIDDALIEKLIKYARRDMNLNEAELRRLELFVNEAEASGQKKTFFTLNDNESISIEILNQDAIDAREKSTQELLFNSREKFPE